MSTDDRDKSPPKDEGRVIAIKTENKDNIGGEECPKLPPTPEMEKALQEAIEAVERKGTKKPRKTAGDMEQDERDHFQNRIRELHIQLMEKDKELDEAKDGAVRTQANLENYKKRVQREQAEKFNYGNEKIARAFLEVLDNLQRTLKHADSADPTNLIEGVKLTLNNIERTFENFDVTPVKALGEKFDPNYHEAIAQAYRDDVEPGTVVEEHQSGFMLKDRLLRPSRVVVSAKPTEDK